MERKTEGSINLRGKRKPTKPWLIQTVMMTQNHQLQNSLAHHTWQCLPLTPHHLVLIGSLTVVPCATYAEMAHHSPLLHQQLGP